MDYKLIDKTKINTDVLLCTKCNSTLQNDFVFGLKAWILIR